MNIDQSIDVWWASIEEDEHETLIINQESKLRAQEDLFLIWKLHFDKIEWKILKK